MGEVKAISRGCFFCKSGKEKDVIRHFMSVFPNDRAIAPTRTKYRRTKDAAIEEQVPLLPGYVFFEIGESGIPTPELTDMLLQALLEFSRSDSVLRLLRYSNTDWRLQGFDDRFAELLFKTNGNIGVSQAYFDKENRIRILRGFLKDYEGSITRVNRKAKTVEVSIDLQGEKVSMRLGYELVEPVNTECDYKKS